MICQPCKDDNHWSCPDVLAANVVRVGRNPGQYTGREEQHDTGTRRQLCDCQHAARRASGFLAAIEHHNQQIRLALGMHVHTEACR
jgi:hypothetical protein